MQTGAVTAHVEGGASRYADAIDVELDVRLAAGEVNHKFAVGRAKCQPGGNVVVVAYAGTPGKLMMDIQ